MKKALMTLILFGGCMIFESAKAQDVEQPKPFEYSDRLSVLAGLIQPLVLKGGNFEVNYATRRLIFDYSHGFSLDPSTSGDYKEQQLSLHLPYSTGFGIGYRFTQFFDIRFEPKMHSWEVYYKDDAQTPENKIKAYKTYTLGFGAYYRYFPFRKGTNKFLQGITTSTSIRWWQNVGSSLDNDAYAYYNKRLNKTETLKAANIGIGNTPVIFNIGVGYTFGGR